MGVLATNRFRLGGIALLILASLYVAAPAQAEPVASIEDVTVIEGEPRPPTTNPAKNAVFTVRLTGETAIGTETVDYSMTDGTATGSVDYVSESSRLEFAEGADSGQITVPIIGDAENESDGETFFVHLTSPNGVTIGDSEAQGTIVDNDVVASIGNAVVTEGNLGIANATFTVSLSGVAAADTETTTTVNYSTADGTATAPGDYASQTNRTLTFAPGELTKQFNIAVVGDTAVESDEAFSVSITGSSPNVTIAVADGTGTISDDDGVLPPPPGTGGSAGGGSSSPGTKNPPVQTRVLRGLTLVPGKSRVSRNALLRLNGLLRVSGGPASCRSRQKIAIQRRKLSGGRFQTFEVAVSRRSGSFTTSTRPVRTYLYRARVSQTTRCMGATSKAKKVVVRKSSKGGGARR
jgi:Calx-beta domain